VNLLTYIRYHQARVRAAAGRYKAFADLYPDLAQREHLYSSSAQFATVEADSYAGAAKLYKSYVWVRKAIALYAQNIAPLPVRVVDASGKPVLDHSLTLRYLAPNDRMPAPRYWAKLITHKLLVGERFSEIVDDARGRPAEFWPRRPDRVQIAPDASRPGYPAVASYHLDELPADQQDVLPENVIHEMFENPLSEWRGLGPIPAVLAGITLDLYAQSQAQTFYRNQARPDYAITAKELQTPDERRRLEVQVDEKYGPGGTRSGRPIILEEGQDIKVLSFPPKDLADLEQRQISRDEVAAIFSVPDILMGFGNDSYDTEEKRDAALAVLWALALLPFVQERDETETHFWRTVRPMLGSGQRIATDLSSVSVLQEKVGPKLENAVRLWGMGVPFDLIDQALRLGIGAIPGGNTGYLPMNLVPGDQLALPLSGQAGMRVLTTKSRRPAASRTAAALQRTRLQVARRMEPKVDQYFQDLADRVVERAREADKSWGRRNGHTIVVKLPTVADLLLRTDEDYLHDLFRSFSLEICSASWETWNLALGTDIAFEQTDPAVVAALSQAGSRVSQIAETTRDAIRMVLQIGAEQGWTIDQLISGVGEAAGLRDVVAESYAGRARAIARTELGEAQQTASIGRYENTNVSEVVVFDGGGEDSDDICNQLNGTVQTLGWARQNKLGHPHCVRCFGPHFGD
jgi:HK97 family phage portal protein